jgi:hypothetical protein
MPNNLKAELLSINYTNNYVDLLILVPITFIQTLQKYGLLKTPLDKSKEKELLKELKEKLKDDETIEKAIKGEIDKANQFIYLYNPETQKIKPELFRVEIQKEGINLYYRITFISKNLNK